MAAVRPSQPFLSTMLWYGAFRQPVRDAKCDLFENSYKGWGLYPGSALLASGEETLLWQRQEWGCTGWAEPP